MDGVVDLGVELHREQPVAPREGLVLVLRRPGEPFDALGQVEGVAVPLHRGTPAKCRTGESTPASVGSTVSQPTSLRSPL